MADTGRTFADLEDRLDLVLPTRGRRARHLARTLAYLRDKGFPGRVLVRTHGSDAEEALISRALTLRGDLDIAVERDDDGVHFLERIRRALSASRAPYVMVHADDDFLVPEGAAAAITCLEADPGLVLAQGRMARLAVDGGGRIGAKPYPVRARPETSALDRVLALLNGYAPLFYAVHRREALAENLAHTLAWSTDTTFWQYLNAAAAVVRGRTAVAEALFYLRLTHEGSWSYRSVADRDPEHPPWIFLSPEFSTLLAKFRDGLQVDLTARHGSLSADDLRRMDDACLALLRRAIGAGATPTDPSNASFHARFDDPDAPETAILRDCARRVLDSTQDG